MAFRRVAEEFAAARAEDAALHAAAIRKRHAASVAGLLKLAEAPADANTALAAIKQWRDGQEQRDLHWRWAAMLQIGSGDRPEDVCAELGIGRTALQQAVRVEGSKLSGFTEFLYKARPKRKEVA